jgi:ribonuclease HII
MPRSRGTGAARCNFEFETLAIAQGFRVIAGCDEAGRGALIGPVYAAAVILDPTALISGLNDSKKLTAPQRGSLAGQIRAKAVAWRVASVSAAEVDAINVYEASRQGMLRALKALVPMPDFILTDAMPLRENGAEFPIPHRSLIHGDALSVTIAAASILAKVERDAHMMKMHEAFPHYGLAKNKGYGTPDHLDALARLGPCLEHRRTYQPVKDCLLPLFTTTLPV